MTLGAVAQSKLKLKAFRFGGTDEYVSFPHHADYNFERTNPFSVSLWAKWTTSAFMVLAHKTTSSAPFRGWFLQTKTTGRIAAQLESTSGPTGFCESSANGLALNDGIWHHVVFTYDGSSTAAGIQIYADGVAATMTTSEDSLSTTIQNTIAVHWGHRLSFSNAFTGDMSDLAIYNKMLSSGEVTTLYNSRCPPRLESVGPTSNLKLFARPSLTDVFPTITDLSAGAHNGTMTNMESTDIFSR